MTANIVQFDAYKKSHVPLTPVVVDLADLSFVSVIKDTRNFWASNQHAILQRIA